jgi:hypothetical protein
MAMVATLQVVINQDRIGLGTDDVVQGIDLRLDGVIDVLYL